MNKITRPVEHGELRHHKGKCPIIPSNYNKIQDLMSSNKVGNEANQTDVFIWRHKSCYSSYTPRSRHVCYAVKYHETSIMTPSDDRSARVLKSHVKSFTREDFKTKCFFCTEACLPKDPKHPDH